MTASLRVPAAAGRGLPLRAAAVLAAALIAAPLLSVAFNVLQPGTHDTWRHLLDTVLTDYIVTTLWLCLGVGVGVTALGVGAAWLVTRYEFPLRGTLEWALLLPLAMPAYVMAYAYTDLLQYVGPVQTALREAFGWRRADYWFPDVRTLGGAVVMFSLVLYPYVYLLARRAFLERAGGVLEATVAALCALESCARARAEGASVAPAELGR